ncbi:MAG TPA: matrixin family metalloprotease, partial [Solirubrobacteraceae bacterium]|nr:matrixin family metalloprotease [Solirubrobacteraceae bacterium]
MGSLRLDRHALSAAALCALVLLAACLFASGPVSGSAVSAGPRASVGADADALFPADGASIALGRELAERHWGGAACDGSVDVAWTVLEPGTNATASWRNPTDAWNNADENFDCRIDFNARADFDWEKLCTVMAHEIGHLLGRQHVADAADLMAPLYSDPLAACATTPDPARPVAAGAPVVEVEPSLDDEVAAVAAAPKPSA